MNEVILFYRENELHGELSNFFALKTPIVFRGKAYATSEHLYQALKFLYDGAPKQNSHYAEQIRLAKTPNMAKILARLKVGGGYKWRLVLDEQIRTAVSNGVVQRSDWEQVKVEQMRMVLKLKFVQDKHCRGILLQTGTASLVENSPFDRFWGSGGRGGKGENMLGKLLVEVRQLLEKACNERAKRKLGME